jgi:AcrR family transcriptional regulator
MASDGRHTGPQSDPDPKRARVAEKVAGKLAAAHADKHDRVAAKIARHAEALEKASDQLARASDQLSALELWTRKSPTPRRPRFTREELAAAAIRIADAEGFAAVSMRRIAAELDSGTMTLYHYVKTKDELLSLVVDAMMGELVVPESDPFPTFWRDAVMLIAQRTRAALLRHSWILEITDDPPVGPNAVRHFDQSMQSVASLDISLADKLDIVSTVDEYVFGFCMHERNNVENGPDPFERAMVDYTTELIETGEYPQLAQLVADHGLEETWAELARYYRDPERFTRGLSRLLDGFAVALHLPSSP